MEGHFQPELQDQGYFCAVVTAKAPHKVGLRREGLSERVRLDTVNV
jgi:hypothetical protein